jgi:hypothetical protein
MSDYVLMAPVGDEYSSVSDELFEDWNNTSSITEISIHVAAFWKYNVKVIEYKDEIVSQFSPPNATEFTATATSTIKDGFALYYTNIGSGNVSTYLDTYVLEPALVSAHSFEPDLFYFKTFSIFNHRGKWYIRDLWSTPTDTITADLSKIIVLYGTVGSNYYTKYTYTCSGTFY